MGCQLAAAVLSCRVQPDRWIAPHLAVRALRLLQVDLSGYAARAAQLLGCLLLIRVGGPSWLSFNGFGSYDERLQFMSRHDAVQLDESLGANDVWSGAAEAALADAFRFIGGSLPSRGFVLGRGSALFRVVRLGGHKVKKARGDAADALDAADVFLYRDSSVAPLLDMRRRFKAVVDVLGATIRSGISLSRSVELAVQWDRILALGPLYPVTLDHLSMDRVWALVHSDVHRRLCDFIHAIVVHRRDEAIWEVAELASRGSFGSPFQVASS